VAILVSVVLIHPMEFFVDSTFLTVKEMAEILRIGKNLAYRHVTQGQIVIWWSNSDQPGRSEYIYSEKHTETGR
jgi:hypothetical protein